MSDWRYRMCLDRMLISLPVAGIIFLGIFMPYLYDSTLPTHTTQSKIFVVESTFHSHFPIHSNRYFYTASHKFTSVQLRTYSINVTPTHFRDDLTTFHCVSWQFKPFTILLHYPFSLVKRNPIEDKLSFVSSLRD